MKPLLLPGGGLFVHWLWIIVVGVVFIDTVYCNSESYLEDCEYLIKSTTLILHLIVINNGLCLKTPDLQLFHCHIQIRFIKLDIDALSTIDLT